MWAGSIAHPSDPAYAFWNKFGSIGDQWLSHLWFLWVLIAYSIILVILTRLLEYRGASEIPSWLDRFFSASPTVQLGVMAAILGTYKLLVAAVFSIAYRYGYYPPLNGLIDLQKLVTYALDFFFGSLIMAQPRLLASLKTLTLVAGVGLGLAIWSVGTDPSADGTMRYAKWIMTGVIAVGMANLIIWSTHKWCNKPSSQVANIVDASFTIYLVHQPIILVLGLLLLGVAFPPLLEEILICLMCFALIYALHRLVRRSSLLLFLLNGMQRPTTRSST